jgi:hypothetical protein
MTLPLPASASGLFFWPVGRYDFRFTGAYESKALMVLRRRLWEVVALERAKRRTFRRQIVLVGTVRVEIVGR